MSEDELPEGFPNPQESLVSPEEVDRQYEVIRNLRIKAGINTLDRTFDLLRMNSYIGGGPSKLVGKAHASANAELAPPPMIKRVVARQGVDEWPVLSSLVGKASSVSEVDIPPNDIQALTQELQAASEYTKGEVDKVCKKLGKDKTVRQLSKSAAADIATALSQQAETETDEALVKSVDEFIRSRSDILLSVLNTHSSYVKFETKQKTATGFRSVVIGDYLKEADLSDLMEHISSPRPGLREKADRAFRQVQAWIGRRAPEAFGEEGSKEEKTDKPQYEEILKSASSHFEKTSDKLQSTGEYASYYWLPVQNGRELSFPKDIAPQAAWALVWIEVSNNLNAIGQRIDYMTTDEALAVLKKEPGVENMTRALAAKSRMAEKLSGIDIATRYGAEQTVEDIEKQLNLLVIKRWTPMLRLDTARTIERLTERLTGGKFRFQNDTEALALIDDIGSRVDAYKEELLGTAGDPYNSGGVPDSPAIPPVISDEGEVAPPCILQIDYGGYMIDLEPAVKGGTSLSDLGIEQP